MNFDFLGLKRLISTTYNPGGRGVKTELSRWVDINGDGVINGMDKVITTLLGDGDFRSKEGIDLLDCSDIVVSNPPFSVWKDYFALLLDHQKKFITIGRYDQVATQAVFTALGKGRVWFGHLHPGTSLLFRAGEKHAEWLLKNKRENHGYRLVNGEVYLKQSAAWYTNLGTPIYARPLPLWKEYTQEAYPKYDNYDAINVDKVAEIPCDYYGEMGVPVTFVRSYCPAQFEIIGMFCSSSSFDKNVPLRDKGFLISGDRVKVEKDGKLIERCGPHVNGETKFSRIIIRRVDVDPEGKRDRDSEGEDGEVNANLSGSWGACIEGECGKAHRQVTRVGFGAEVEVEVCSVKLVTSTRVARDGVSGYALSETKRSRL